MRKYRTIFCEWVCVYVCLSFIKSRIHTNMHNHSILKSMWKSSFELLDLCTVCCIYMLIIIKCWMLQALKAFYHEWWACACCIIENEIENHSFPSVIFQYIYIDPPAECSVGCGFVYVCTNINAKQLFSERRWEIGNWKLNVTTQRTVFAFVCELSFEQVYRFIRYSLFTLRAH